MGKLPNNELKKLLSCIKPDDRVVIPPMVGYDAGVHFLGDKYLAVASDPCTGVPEEWFGFLLINYAASDLALCGAKPEFCTINLLGPRPTDHLRFQKIMKQTCQAADELGIAIVRGHTGMYDSLNDLVGVCTVYGIVEPRRLVTSGGARPGDLILCTKPIGIETLTNYSIIFKETAKSLFGLKRQQELAEQFHMQSCVKEALALAEIEGLDAMHDATEGGVVAAINELADASKLGFIVDWGKISVPSEVLALKTRFGLSDEQMLSISSTGTILAAVKPDAKAKVDAALKELGLNPLYVGEFTEKQDKMLLKGKNTVPFPGQADDPYTMIFGEKPTS